MLKSRQQIIMRMRINGKTVCVAITILIVVVLVITPLIAAYSLYNSVTTYINQVVLNFNRNGFDGLSEVSGLRKLVNEGKIGGFINLQQQTLDRLFIVSQPIPSNGEDSKAKNQGGRSISFFGLDVSHSGEALYIYKRILNRPSFNAKLLIVDIGANDGLLSSNSFNFIQWGWDAILVEPQKKELQYAKYNTRRYRDRKVHEGQHVHFVNAVIGEKTGSVELVVPDDLVSMQAHIKTNNTAQLKGKTVQVPSMTVADLAEEYNIPKYFGILSIDAEGVGDKILRAWISQGFRPFYIIYESLHNNESIRNTNRLLLRSGYTYLTKRGWNYLFEYNLESN